MVGILKSFEETATGLSPIILVLPGLVATGVGLFIWLGGTGFRWLGRAVVGAASGVVMGFCLGNQRLGPVILFALVGFFLGAAFPRLFTAALSGVLGLVVAFLIAAWPYLGQDRGTLLAAEPAGQAGEVLSTEESLEVVRVSMVDLTDSVKLAGRQLPPGRWAVIAMAGLGVLGAALLLRHLAGALSCSIVGAALIFAGLVLLLLHKGSDPITRIGDRPGYYVLVFLIVVLFGTTEQWLLCRRRFAKSRRKPKRSESDQGPSKRSWRGR